ncbi:cytochrome P450 1A1-like [Haliotis asinina]|uniref:cytochrome P450 1A1-like n=1 Tax=Haliotis asinina TaxID=109174 RepID=UPI003532554D
MTGSAPPVDESTHSHDGESLLQRLLLPLDILHTDCLYTHHWTLILAATSLSLFFIFKKTQKHLPPGPWTWPLIGHINYFRNKPHIKLSNLKEKYGDIYRLRMGSHKFVVACSLEAVLEGLIHKGGDFSDRPDFEVCHILYNGNRHQGISTADYGEKTAMKRNFLDFSLDVYCSNSDNIEDIVAADILEVVNKFVETDKPLDPFYTVESACLNIMTRLAYGQRFDPAGRVMQEILSTFHARNFAKCFNAVDYVPFLKAFSPREDLEFVQEKTMQQILYQRKIMNVHKDSYDPGSIRDMMDHLLLYLETGEDHGLMEKEDIDFLMMDFANAGYETTAVVLTWLLGYMAMNPDIQVKVQQELDGVVGNDRLPSLQDQPYLPYTSAVIFEAERLASVYPFLQPHVARSNCKLQGFDITEGTILLMNVWSIHHDSRYWKHPMKFNPRRFLTEENSLEIPDHFLPYGAGTRRCPGESLAEIMLFLFFSTIMHQLTVKPVSKKFCLEGEYDFLIRPQPFALEFEEREG